MSLRNYLDKIRPKFEEGGSLHAFKSVYDGFDSFLYVSSETSKSGTSIHDAIDSKRIMSIVVISLLPHCSSVCTISAIRMRCSPGSFRRQRSGECSLWFP